MTTSHAAEQTARPLLARPATGDASPTDLDVPTGPALGTAVHPDRVPGVGAALGERTAADRLAARVEELTGRALSAARRTTGRVLVCGRTDAPALVEARAHALDPVLAARVRGCTPYELAAQVLDDRGVGVHADDRVTADAWQAAWQRSETTLDPPDPSRWTDEVARAIKGRGLTRFSEYAATHGDDDRSRAVWDLYATYDEELTRRFAYDRDDLVTMAVDELDTRPARLRFAAVVVDTTLPLTPMMAHLIRLLT